MTPFELRVLRAIAAGASIAGHGMVAWVAAARRLEKRGLVVKELRWYLTTNGWKALDYPPSRPRERVTEQDGTCWDYYTHCGRQLDAGEASHEIGACSSLTLEHVLLAGYTDQRRCVERGRDLAPEEMDALRAREILTITDGGLPVSRILMDSYGAIREKSVGPSSSFHLSRLGGKPDA